MEGRIDSAVQPERIVDFFKSIIRIPSPRFGEIELARHIGAFLSGVGVHVQYPRVERADRWTEQVIGTWGTNRGGKRVLLNAHMDAGSGLYQGLIFQPQRWTKDPLQPVVEGGYIYGLGAHNNKQGITAIVMALDALVKSGATVDGEVIVACVAAETSGGIGAAELVKAGLNADVGVVVEATGLDIVTNSVGKIRGRILVSGEHAHHLEHVGPLENLRHLLEAFSPCYGQNFARGFLTHVPEPALQDAPNVGIRLVRSDPQDLDCCAAFFDVTSVPSMSPESVKADLERMFQIIKGLHPKFHAEVDMRGWEPPVSHNYIWGANATPENSDIVECISNHHVAVCGRHPTIGTGRRSGVGSDAASFRKAGIRTVEYGPGAVGPGEDLLVWPAVDERVRVQDVINCVRVLARSSYELANQPRR